MVFFKPPVLEAEGSAVMGQWDAGAGPRCAAQLQQEGTALGLCQDTRSDGFGCPAGLICPETAWRGFPTTSSPLGPWQRSIRIH